MLKKDGFDIIYNEHKNKLYLGKDFKQILSLIVNPVGKRASQISNNKQLLSPMLN